MEKFLFILFCLFLTSSSFHPQDEPLNFTFAQNYCEKIQDKTDKIGVKYNLKSSEILPIVFPECARFNATQNILESSILEYFYLEGGSAKSDFSVGYFQMKPSFIENLESKIAKSELNSTLKKQFLYKSKIQPEIREERLNRLFDESWQIEYLCAFTRIMVNRYEKENIKSSKIQFMASAYNLGFQKSTKEIINWQEISAFPNGKNVQTGNYSYAKLAEEYSQKNFSNEN